MDSFDNPDLASMVPSNCRSDYTHFFTSSEGLDKDKSLQDLFDKINETGLRPVAVIAGAETGVELADRLSEKVRRHFASTCPEPCHPKPHYP